MWYVTGGTRLIRLVLYCTSRGSDVLDLRLKSMFWLRLHFGLCRLNNDKQE